MVDELHVQVHVTKDNTKRIVFCLPCNAQLIELTGMPNERRLMESAVEIHTQGPNGMSKPHDIVTFRVMKDSNTLGMSQGAVMGGDMPN